MIGLEDNAFFVKTADSYVKVVQWAAASACRGSFEMSILIIAEAGVNHNGDMALAKKL